MSDHKSETAKQRQHTTKYCYRWLQGKEVPGCGVDVASQGDPVVPWAMNFDLPQKDFAYYNSNNPPHGPIQLRGDAKSLPFEDNSLDFCYCVLPNQTVRTPLGDVPISSIKEGDYVLGVTGFTRVTKVFVRSFGGGIVSFKSGKSTLEVTANHPIATPFGWSRADQLRESDIVIHPSPQVQFSKLGDRFQILSGVRRDFQMPSPRSISIGIPKGNSPFAERNNDLCLSLFGKEKRFNQSEQADNSGCVALKDQSVSGFPSLVPRFKGSLVDTYRHSVVGEYIFDPVNYPQIAVRDLDGWNYTSTRGESETNASLSVYYPGHPCEHQVVLKNIHSVSQYTYNGNVYNLKTDDSTFFVNSVLTHNCSHLLEDYPDWTPALKEWVRVVKPGGYLIVMIPDRERWVAACAAGQCPNDFHRHEGKVGELSTYAEQLGLEVIEDRFTDSHPGDYNILFVAKKIVKP